LKKAAAPPPLGSVYLIHFSRRFHHAQHYIGFSIGLNPSRRIALHRAGVSRAMLMRALHRAGIPFHVSRVWYGVGRGTERKLKRRNGGIRAACPLCSGDAAWSVAIYTGTGADNGRKGGAVGRGKKRAARLSAHRVARPVHLDGW
jgi:hypothetical protein